MSKTSEHILFFWEDPGSNQIKIIKQRYHNSHNVTFVPANVTPSEIQKNFGESWTELKVDFSEEEKDAREIYLDIFAKLPMIRLNGKLLANSLKWKNTNLYWFIGHAEKSLWRSKLPHQIYTFLKIKKITEQFPQHKLILISKDKPFNSLFSNIEIISEKKNNTNILLGVMKSYIKEVFKLIYKKWAIKKYHKPKQALPDGTIALFSQFPEWWVYKDEKITERFFGDIFDYTNKNFSIIIRLNYWKDFVKKKKDFAKFLMQDNVYITEHYNTFLDSISALLLNIKIYKYLREIKKNNEIKIPFKNIVISDLDFWAQSGMSTWTIFTFLALTRLKISTAKIIFYRNEFHPHEAAIYYSAPNITKIGLQHSAFGKNFFNYQFLEMEIQKNNIPSPNIFWVTGYRIKKLLLKAGVSQDKIKVIGILRQAHLYNVTSSNNSIQFVEHQHLTILWPLSQLINENIEMLEIIKKASKLTNKNLKLLIKFNPNKRQDPIYYERINSYLKNLPNNLFYEFVPDHQDLTNLMPKCQCLYVTGGSAPFEAMIKNKPSIVFYQNFMLGHNPIEEYPEGCFLIANENDFYQATEKLISLHEVDKIQQSWDTILKEIMGDINKNPKTLALQLINEYSKLI